MEYLTGSPEVSFRLEHEGSTLGGTSCLGSGVNLRQIFGSLVGFRHDEVYHLLIACTWELLFFDEWIISVVDEGYTTKHSPQHIIVIASHEVRLTDDAVLLVAIADIT